MFGSKKVFGLDIGSSTIKLAEMDVSKNRSKLVSFSLTQTPSGAITAGEITDPAAVATIVKSLVKQSKVRRKNVCSGMWGPSVIVKKIAIPQMEQSLIREQIKWEAEQYIPFDVKEINLDYHLLRRKSSNTENIDVILVAAKQDLILNYVETLEAAGLKCLILDVAGFALANCYEANYGRESSEVVGLLNVGAAVTNFVVVEAGEVIFCRDIPVGGQAFTNDIHKEMGISPDEAETLKLSATMGQQVPPEVNKILGSSNEVIAEEIRHSFEFFSATASGVNISRLFITGGSSAIPGLSQQISQAVSLQVEYFDPFARVAYDSRKFSQNFLEQIRPFVSIVMGLALRGGNEG